MRYEARAHMLETSELAPLRQFAHNVYSQCGEDGIIEEVLKRIGRSCATDGWCVEFGAWDGIYLSNTYNLIRNRNYKGVLIEGNPSKYRELCKNIPQADVHKVCRFVTFDGDSTLDRILEQTPITADFDFLSIDIDGCDYFILDSLKQFRPKVICIEFNPTVPNEVDFVQPRDFKVQQGAAAKSLADLARSKGYSLVAVTDLNLILVRDDLASAVVGDATCTLESLRDDSWTKTFLFYGYDGTVLSNKSELRLPWHGVTVPLRDFQPLPKVLRTFSSDYTLAQKILFVLLVAVKWPACLKAKIAKRLKPSKAAHSQV